MLDSVYLIKFIVSFAIVIVLIYAVYYFVNRYGLKLNTGSQGNINVKEIRFLQKNKSLCIVEVKDTTFLLALDESGIKKIKEWKKEESPQQPPENKN